MITDDLELRFMIYDFINYAIYELQIVLVLIHELRRTALRTKKYANARLVLKHTDEYCKSKLC